MLISHKITGHNMKSANNWLSKSLIFLLLAISSMALSGCATPESDSQFFVVQKEILLPVSGLYLGNNPPKCTDETSTMVQLKTDQDLYICSGTEKGWRKIRGQKDVEK